MQDHLLMLIRREPALPSTAEWLRRLEALPPARIPSAAEAVRADRDGRGRPARPRRLGRRGAPDRRVRRPVDPSAPPRRPTSRARPARPGGPVGAAPVVALRCGGPACDRRRPGGAAARADRPDALPPSRGGGVGSAGGHDRVRRGVRRAGRPPRMSPSDARRGAGARRWAGIRRRGDLTGPVPGPGPVVPAPPVSGAFRPRPRVERTRSPSARRRRAGYRELRNEQWVSTPLPPPGGRSHRAVRVGARTIRTETHG